MIYWLVVEPTPLKNDGVKVSWDDDIPNSSWKVIKFRFQSTNPSWLYHLSGQIIIMSWE